MKSIYSNLNEMLRRCYHVRRYLLLLSYAFFLVSLTASAQNYIKSVNSDRSAYSPGTLVNLSLTLKQSVTNRTLKITYYYLSEPIDSQTYTISGTSKTWSWTPPSIDFKGYMAKIELKNGTTLLDKGSFGIDVSSDWTRFPRYGYLSDFGQKTDYQMDSQMVVIKRYHLNGLQYYDWMDRHEKPLAGTPSNPAPSWNNISHTPCYFNTVKGFIDRGHNLGIKSMFYNLVYGAYGDAVGVDPQWGLYSNNDHSWHDRHPLGSWGESDIFLYDPANPNWQNFLNNAHNDVYNAANLHFDGFHVDQLGRDWEYRYDGSQYNIANYFHYFLNAAKSAQPGKNLVMNAVNQTGQASIAQAPVDFLYTEVWGPNDTYSSLANIIQQNNAFKNVNNVLAAYVHKREGGDPDNSGYFNNASVLMTDAVIFAFGGAHIELGEHMLSNEWFPNTQLAMTAGLQDTITRYYDFSVAYQNILRDGRTFNNVTLTGDATVAPWPAALGKIATVGVKWGNNQVFHVLNYNGATTLDWRDKWKTQTTPTRKKNVPMSFPFATALAKLWVASPDTNNGLPIQVSFTQNNGVVNFNLPYLRYWTMVVAEPVGVSSGVYKFTAVHSGKALEIAYPATADGALAQQWGFASGSNQKWKLEATGDGYVKIISVNSGKLLDLYQGGTTDGTPVHQWAEAGVQSQQWKIERVNGGVFKIVNRLSGKALDVYGSSMSDGAAVKTYTYTGGTNQQWGMELVGYTTPVVGKNYKIVARHSGKVLDVSANSTADGALVNQWTNADATNQKWQLKSTTDGYYKLIALHSNKAMDVVGGSSTDGAGIHQWTESTVESQKWSLVDVGSGYFKIVNKNSGKVLDVAGASTADGAMLNQYPYGNATNQQFTFELASGFGNNAVAKVKNNNTISNTPQEMAMVYPNPAKDRIYVNLTQFKKGFVGIILTDISGQQVYRSETKAGTTFALLVNQFPAGTYILQLKSKSKELVYKVIVSH